MDTLDRTEWEILIAGTGIQQSLLALALSRSDKKVLHIDQNDYYGGAEAAFSLQEAEGWAKKLEEPSTSQSSFRNTSITQAAGEQDGSSKLAASRKYTLALAPQLIYADSRLLPALVSSKTYKQLEFVAMGSWFVFDESIADADSKGTLWKIPTTREDLVFSDNSIDIRSKRAVMKVLRFLMEYETHEEQWRPYAQKPFSAFLLEHFKLAERFHSLFSALTLSLDGTEHTDTAFALPRIARHLRSMGHLGPGFNAVIPKWGGLSEIAQVGCRAGAVGGAVYVLNKGMKTVSDSEVTLGDGEKVKTPWIAGTREEIGLAGNQAETTSTTTGKVIRRSISIISSALPSLFPTLAEGGPPPAGAVVVFPGGSLGDDSPPVYLIIHSSDTGECPQGQCVVYATTLGSVENLDKATQLLTELVQEDPAPMVLWRLNYEQHSHQDISRTNGNAQTIVFPESSMDLAFDEIVLDNVRAAWQKITGGEAQDFLVFEERNPDADEDEE